MRRFFTFVLGGLALIAVALISAFIAMRLAIHGREAVVPNLSGLTVAEANSLVVRQGLALNLENTFYSTDVPAGRILSQDPAADSRVRRDWTVRVTESLGAQRVDIPDLTGETERAATIGIRRLSLELGAVSHMAFGGDPDIVLAQTPPANSGGVDGPRVSLLVSDPIPASMLPAYAMPSLVGLSTAAASALAAGTGLHLVVATENTPASGRPVETTNANLANSASTANPSTATVHSSGVVIAQTPQAGSRVVQGDIVHVTLGRPTPAAAESAATP